MLISTLATGLGRISRVYLDNRNTPFMSFIGEEALELSKRPAMQAALCVCMPLHLCSTTNMGQVLNHDSAPWSSILNNSLAEYMVMVFTLAQQFPTQAFEMPLRRVGAFCLKLATQTEDTTFLLFPSTAPQKVLVGGDGRVVQAQIMPIIS